jgi:hypothetical protein
VEVSKRFKAPIQNMIIGAVSSTLHPDGMRLWLKHLVQCILAGEIFPPSNGKIPKKESLSLIFPQIIHDISLHRLELLG